MRADEGALARLRQSHSNSTDIAHRPCPSHHLPRARFARRGADYLQRVGSFGCDAVGRQPTDFVVPAARRFGPTALLFEPRSHCLVEAITDVVYRTFKRSDLKATLFKHPEMFDKLSKAWIEEKDRADQLIVDLGRRTADERIAWLMLNLAERLSQRGMTRTTETSAIEMEFPLRQHHVADATGLTPVHVSKVLSEFRRGGLIKISDRSLTILDPIGFRRVAHTR